MKNNETHRWNGASRDGNDTPQHSRTPTQRGAINHNRIQKRGREARELDKVCPGSTTADEWRLWRDWCIGFCSVVSVWRCSSTCIGGRGRCKEPKSRTSTPHFFVTPRRGLFALRSGTKTNQNFSPILRFFRTVTPYRWLERKELNGGIGIRTAEVG